MDWMELRGRSARRVRQAIGNHDVERVDVHNELRGMGVRVERVFDRPDGYMGCLVEGDHATLWTNPRTPTEERYDLAYGLGVIMTTSGDIERGFQDTFLNRDQASRFAERFLVSPEKLKELFYCSVPSIGQMCKTFGVSAVVVSRIWEPYSMGKVA